MLYNWGVADFQRGSEKIRDLPEWAIALMRVMVRDCRAPGRYMIEVEVPQHPKNGRSIEISRVETIRRLDGAG